MLADRLGSTSFEVLALYFLFWLNFSYIEIQRKGD